MRESRKEDRRAFEAQPREYVSRSRKIIIKKKRKKEVSLHAYVRTHCYKKKEKRKKKEKKINAREPWSYLCVQVYNPELTKA